MTYARVSSVVPKVLHETRTQQAMETYVCGVMLTWERYWRGKDHRYGRDPAAFLGERLLTDFDLRMYDGSSEWMQ